VIAFHGGVGGHIHNMGVTYLVCYPTMFFIFFFLNYFCCCYGRDTKGGKSMIFCKFYKYKDQLRHPETNR
jgi:hypothetical protein